jgi:PIN domain nuclease of toxin-antitoxin system
LPGRTAVGVLEAAAHLPRHHGDPFDRVLVAHALEEDLSILTRDAAFPAHGVRVATSPA